MTDLEFQEIKLRTANWLQRLIVLSDERVMLSMKIEKMKAEHQDTTMIEEVLDQNKQEMINYVKTKTP